MKRLTKRLENGQAIVADCGDNCKYNHQYCDSDLWQCPTLTMAYEKLAQYEDLAEQKKIRLALTKEKEIKEFYKRCVNCKWFVGFTENDDPCFMKTCFAYKRLQALKKMK